ncbi:hypothetical protein PO909_010795 [Leuciscus waleckii]
MKELMELKKNLGERRKREGYRPQQRNKEEREIAKRLKKGETVLVWWSEEQNIGAVPPGSGLD